MRVQPFFDARTFTVIYVVFDEATRDAVVIDQRSTTSRSARTPTPSLSIE